VNRVELVEPQESAEPGLKIAVETSKNISFICLNVLGKGIATFFAQKVN
jgi:hypothetical protein